MLPRSVRLFDNSSTLVACSELVTNRGAGHAPQTHSNGTEREVVNDLESLTLAGSHLAEQNQHGESIQVLQGVRRERPIHNKLPFAFSQTSRFGQSPLHEARGANGSLLCFLHECAFFSKIVMQS